MAGLSMGGMQTNHITLSHLDLFSYIAGFSGAAGPFITGRDLDLKNDYNGVLADPAAFEKKVHVLWLGVGTAEPERMRDSIRKLQTPRLDRRRHLYMSTRNRQAPITSGRPGGAISTTSRPGCSARRIR